MNQDKSVEEIILSVNKEELIKILGNEILEYNKKLENIENSEAIIPSMNILAIVELLSCIVAASIHSKIFNYDLVQQITKEFPISVKEQLKNFKRNIENLNNE